MIRLAINGFGRIGRITFRKFFEETDQVEIVAINDLGDVSNLAYLLEHDSAQGKFKKGKISFDAQKHCLRVCDKSIAVFQERDPSQLPWKELNVDVVIESTGFFRTKEKAGLHLEAGAKKVVISAPASGAMPTIVYGVNHKTLTAEDKIISCASCTTNCLVPVTYVLEKEYGIKKGFMTTVHASTNDQKILDFPHSDFRRGRSCYGNIIPTNTGASVAAGKVLPAIAGKIDGIALRIPSITGSLVDLSVELKQTVTVEEINAKMAEYSQGCLKGVMEYETQPIVSSDVIGSHYGSIFDSTLTRITNTEEAGQLVKVFAWYDNEASYVSQMVRSCIYFAQL